MAQEFAKSFYKSKLWQEVRESILKRDNYLCQTKGCYNPAEEVHHKTKLTPENINDTNISVNPSNLISLCAECHKAIHLGDKVAGIRKKTKEQQSILPDVIFDENGYPIVL